MQIRSTWPAQEHGGDRHRRRGRRSQHRTAVHLGRTAYLALGIFVVGHIWRWRYDQFGWTSRSTQLQERRLLKWGSPLFHYGTFAAIAGHVIGILIPESRTHPIGILIPESRTHPIGIPEPVYRWFSAAAGTLAAVLVIGGIVVLAGRRLLIPRVRATTSPVDYVALILLLLVILTGIAPTIGVNLLGHGYDYRTTVAPWFRGLFTGSPDVAAISHAPIIYQVHATAAWLIWAVWPFSRLVHAWSYPLWYLWRPYIVYRSRRPSRPLSRAPAGAGGARSAYRTDLIHFGPIPAPRHAARTGRRP